MKQITGQLDMTTALRDKCQIVKGYPCTHYVASQYRYLHEKLECKATCCCACKEKKMCGWACNASKVNN